MKTRIYKTIGGLFRAFKKSGGCGTQGAGEVRKDSGRSEKDAGKARRSRCGGGRAYRGKIRHIGSWSHFGNDSREKILLPFMKTEYPPERLNGLK